MTINHFLDLKGKTVVVIGGYGLIGKAICEGFTNLDCNIIIADKKNNPDLIKKIKNKKKSQVSYFQFDISKTNDINKLIAYTIKKHTKIDVLVNCSFPRTNDWSKNIENVPYTSVKKNLLDHLGGYYNTTQKVALQMAKQKSGNIINFSSIYGLVGPTFSIYKNTDMTSAPAYSLIKGGINTMTRYFASYFGKYNIRVNCISPGGVFDNQDEIFVKKYSNLTPLGRMANPEDVVLPVLFLASDGAKYITGHNLVVDGGWVIH